jgi:hypothetical protein
VLLDRYEENKTIARNLAYLLPENLYRVFNETDLDKRKAATADLWNEDGIFSLRDGRPRGRTRCSAKALRDVLSSDSRRLPQGGQNSALGDLQVI